MIQPCDQMEFTSITKKNACHISNQNEEMGLIQKDVLILKQDFKYFRGDVGAIKESVSALEIHATAQDLTMTQMATYQQINMWFGGIVMVAVVGALVGIAIKKIFGNNK